MSAVSEGIQRGHPQGVLPGARARHHGLCGGSSHQGQPAHTASCHPPPLPSTPSPPLPLFLLPLSPLPPPPPPLPTPPLLLPPHPLPPFPSLSPPSRSPLSPLLPPSHQWSLVWCRSCAASSSWRCCTHVCPRPPSLPRTPPSTPPTVEELPRLARSSPRPPPSEGVGQVIRAACYAPPTQGRPCSQVGGSPW